MADERYLTVTDVDGVSGRIAEADLLADSAEDVLVHLDDGRDVFLPAALFNRQENGSYRLPFSLNQMDMDYSLEVAAQPTVRVAPPHEEVVRIPVVEETIHIEKRPVEKGRVRFVKTVQEREEVVDVPLMEEEVEVNHVPINQLVDRTEAVRHEGETMIVPIYEEVLVVRKRLMLKEELHITRRKREVNRPQTITVRREVVEVERLEGSEESAGLAPEQGSTELNQDLTSSERS
jgi:uncharacterized protein (TIGR02271 family)